MAPPPWASRQLPVSLSVQGPRPRHAALRSAVPSLALTSLLCLGLPSAPLFRCSPAVRHLHPASGQPLLPVRLQRGLPHACVSGLDVCAPGGGSPGQREVCWGRSRGGDPDVVGGGALGAVGGAEPSLAWTPFMSAPSASVICLANSCSPPKPSSVVALPGKSRKQAFSFLLALFFLFFGYFLGPAFSYEILVP